MSHDQTNDKAIARAERRAEAVRLRGRGKTIRQVAEALGISPSQAHREIEAALREIPAEDVDNLRKIESGRLDNLQNALWESALLGDVDAVDRVLKIIAQRRALFGLDAPQKVDVSTGDVDLESTVSKILQVAEIAVRGQEQEEVDE